MAVAVVSEERLAQIAQTGDLSQELVREWCRSAWSMELQQWLQTPAAGEIAVWIEANARELQHEDDQGQSR